MRTSAEGCVNKMWVEFHPRHTDSCGRGNRGGGYLWECQTYKKVANKLLALFTIIFVLSGDLLECLNKLTVKFSKPLL